MYRQQECGRGDRFDAALRRGQHYVQFRRGAVGDDGRGLAIRSPEGDPARASRVGRQEHRAVLGQFGEFGGWCRGKGLHSSGALLKFDYSGRVAEVQHVEGMLGMSTL
jgi:hypothetical protein